MLKVYKILSTTLMYPARLCCNQRTAPQCVWFGMYRITKMVTFTSFIILIMSTILADMLVMIWNTNWPFQRNYYNITQNKLFYVDWVDLNCQLIHTIGIWFELLTGGCHFIDNVNYWKWRSVKYNEFKSTSMKYKSIHLLFKPCGNIILYSNRNSR